jgi:hypothetical protein
MGNQNSKDKSQTALISSLNTMVSTSIIKTITSCFQESAVSQNIELLCEPKLSKVDIDNPNISVYEENSACTRCITLTQNAIDSHISAEKSMWSSSPAQVRQPIDTFYNNILEELETCGLTVCKACVLSNITQSNILNADSTCIQNNITTEGIQLNLSSLLQESLLNNQDVLSQVADALKNNNLQSISDTISSRVVSTLSASFFNQLISRIQNGQSLIVKGSSIKFNQLSQEATFTIVSNYVDKENIATLAYAESTYQVLADEINQQNTLNSVGDVIFDSSVSFVTAIDSSVGLVMFAILVVLGVVFASIVIYSIYSFFKNTIQTSSSVAKSIKHNKPVINKYTAYRHY